MHHSELLGSLSIGGFFIGLLMIAAGVVLHFIFTIIGLFSERDLSFCRKFATGLTFYGSILSAISFGTCALSFGR